MKKCTVLLLSLCWSLCISQAQETIPTFRIQPEDIVQSTIKLEQSWGGTKIEVSWTYTEAGAQKLVDFVRQHLGQKMCEQIGGFKHTIADVDKFDDNTNALDVLEHWKSHQRMRSV